ncbi:MAG TPA: histidine triad nucleotide-binding protein [Gammaproteobacteria bacterium]|nr:histidine triad nucleotide-binding protein [Gammaproteobacteria bacterium]
MSDCLFCKIIAGELPGDIVFQNDEFVAFRDINPQAPTHLLIVPRRHIPTLNDLTDKDAGLTGRLSLVAKELATREGIAEDGYRVVMNCNAGAGQTVWHIHMHLLGGRTLTWPPG